MSATSFAPFRHIIGENGRAVGAKPALLQGDIRSTEALSPPLDAMLLHSSIGGGSRRARWSDRALPLMPSSGSRQRSQPGGGEAEPLAYACGAPIAPMKPSGKSFPLEWQQ
jgi:hypothetical protein